MKLGQKVYIVQDSFEQNLPIGKHAYIIAYEKNHDNAFDYIVRVPHANKHFAVPKQDIELEETIIHDEAEKIQKELLIDFALATRNEVLFKKVMNGDVEEEEEVKPSLSQQDFIKQVNLRAWI